MSNVSSRQDKTMILFRALYENRLKELVQFLNEGADVNCLATEETSHIDFRAISPGDTLLHPALWKEQKEAVEVLLRYNPNLNLTSQDGVSPLVVAIGKGLDEIAIWLIKAGANCNALDKFGLSAIHYAPDVNLLKEILGRGVCVNLVAHSTGWSPLHYAAHHGQFRKTEFLLQHEANPNSIGLQHETPLHLLVAVNHRDVKKQADLLLGAGADINAIDDKGNTPLHWALGVHRSKNFLDGGNLKSVNYLLNQKARADIKNADGLTASTLAWRNPKSEFRARFQEVGLRPTILEKMKNVF
jgi:ankyrin repeat protein